jgi:nucleoside-diphosphate-sugar epimerase
VKILFIGGTGIITSGVSPLVVERGMELYLLNRGTRQEFFPKGAHQVVADVRDHASVRDALRGLSFDAVVDWLAFTPDHVESDIELFRDRTSQFVFISSASAYQKPPVSFPITESTPLVNPYSAYSQGKIACEDRLLREFRDTRFPMTIVRPSFTYGLTMIPAGYQSWAHPWTLVDRMRKGRKIIVHGDGTSLWTMTHNTDFARAFVGLLGNARAIGHAVHITSDEVLTWDQVVRAIGAAAGAEPDIIHIPSDFIAAFDPDARASLLGDKAHCAVFDNSKIKSLVPGFTATVPFTEGIRRSVAWYDGHPERRTVDDVFNAHNERIIAAWEGAMGMAKGE